jgi:hypothetical protein
VGDLGLWPLLQQWGGLINTLTVLLFLVNNIRAIKAGTATAYALEGKSVR